MRMVTAVALILATACVVSGEDRVVLVELFTATWCATCPYADAALDSLALEMGPDSLATLQYHVADSYATPETEARADYYLDQIRLPNAWFDGTTSVHEVSSVPDAYSKYRQKIDERLAVSAPLNIESTAALDDSSGEMSTMIRVIDPFADEALRFYAVLYENEVGEYNYVVRDILPSQELSISAPGDSIEVSRVFDIDTLWNKEELGMVVFVQSDSTKQVLQAEKMEYLPTRVETDRRTEVAGEISTRIWPNPFRSSVRFSVSSSSGKGGVEIGIHDSSGRQIRRLIGDPSVPPDFSVCWDGRDSSGERVASGVYYARLVVPHGRLVRKVVCIR
jgi:hypothetical protein